MKNVFLDTNILVDYALGREHGVDAKAAGCDVIVTNNGRDFAEFSDLPFMSAADFLRQLS